MTASWKKVYEGEHEGRPVEVRESNDKTFKILTTQKFYEEGIAYQDGPNFVHISPSSVGEAVESEVMSRSTLEEALKELHFSNDTVQNICSKVP